MTYMNTTSLGRVLAVSMASVLLLGTTGCLVGGSSKVQREGHYVAATTLSQIRHGETTQAWVQAVVGEPTERVKVDDRHEIWKYAYTETKNSRGYVFLIFHGKDQKTIRDTVFIEFENGVVTKTWRG